MGYDLHKYERFHTFSVVPAGATSELAMAVNKAGHIVQANEVRAEAIPYCGLQGSLDAIKSAYADYPIGTLASVRNSDNLYQKTADGVWTQIAIPAKGGFTPITANGQAVSDSNPAILRWHYQVPLTYLNAANNGQDSNRYSAKYLGVDGVSEAVNQFVSSTDNIYNNAVSSGYDIKVTKGGTAMNKGESEANDQWMDSPYSGMILFMKQQDAGSDIRMTCFEYVGKTVQQQLNDIKVDTAGGIKGVTEGTGIIVDANTSEGLRPTVSVDTDVIATKQYVTDTINGLDSTNNGGNGISVVQTNGVVSTTVNPATISDGIIAPTHGDHVVTAQGAKDIADKSAADKIAAATLADGKEIATATGDDTTKLVTVEDVTTYVTPLEQKVNDHLLDAAGKLEITVIADKLPKKPFFEANTAYVNSYGFEWEKLANNIYTDNIEVKVAQSVSGLNEFKSHTDGTVLTPSSLGTGTCKLVVYSINDAKELTEVAVSQANTFDTSTSTYAFKFDSQISLSAGVRYRICFINVDDANTLHCLPVILNSSAEGADVTKNETPTRYIIGDTEDDWWGCWNLGAGTVNGVQQVAYGPKVSISGLTPTPDADGDTLVGEKGKIYLISNEGTENQNVYDEYVWTNGVWEKIGTTKVDLTDYATKDFVTGITDTKADKSTTYTKTQVDTELAKKANSADVYTKTQVDTELGKKADKETTYTKTEVDTALSGKADADAVVSSINDLQGEVTIKGLYGLYVYSNSNDNKVIISETEITIDSTVFGDLLTIVDKLNAQITNNHIIMQSFDETGTEGSLGSSFVDSRKIKSITDSDTQNNTTITIKDVDLPICETLKNVTVDGKVSCPNLTVKTSENIKLASVEAMLYFVDSLPTSPTLPYPGKTYFTMLHTAANENLELFNELNAELEAKSWPEVILVTDDGQSVN